ncbi:amphi-Trp domain-containing protein [Natrinema gelatinilyticum]|uniref:amphi-Trp domain-containing protein n=1 Tax=Natrinema gelatinilyticum TaxID=2961571 RepID=UPI0020C367D0|nr:amphi-Trp domain-containing protein [Natrinema gelatinilyticum]
MAQRTTADETLPRQELSAYLRDLATEFEQGGGTTIQGEEQGEETVQREETITVPVGNKDVSLHPPQNVDVSVEVVERSSMLRGDRETIDIELSWKP